MKTIKEQILESLAGIDRPVSFCASGTLPLVLPGLEVNGIGPIGLPLNESAALELIGCCRQAPYGKGTKTVVDTNVRRVWELDPEQFQLLNPEWPNCMDRVMSAIQQHLGLQDQPLESQLYKLLIYEKGGFFLPHKDGEKVDRMVATCIISLPSPHEGGSLVIRHAGEEVTIRFDSPENRFNLQYAAFYSDCEHEVKPVESGYRLCLVYNLVLTGNGRAAVQAPNFGQQADRLTSLIQKWKASKASHSLAIALTYEYSKDGLSPENLKGEDQSRAAVIRSAAEKAGCRATLALLTLWEIGSAEDDSGDDYYGRSSRSRRDREDPPESSYHMLDVDDFSLTADHWVAFDGTRPSFGELRFDEDQLIADVPIRELTPEEDFEGYTGNAGMTLERWYRQAIIAIWPVEAHYRVVCGAGTTAAVEELCRMAEMIPTFSGIEQLRHREECRRFAGAVISTWKFNSSVGKESSADRMLKALACIGSRKQFLKFLIRIAPAEKVLSDVRLLAQQCRRFGWTVCQPGLNAIFEKKEGRFLVRNAKLLHALCRIADTRKEKQDGCRTVASVMLQAITVWALQVKLDHWEDGRVQAKVLVLHLLKALCRLDDEDLLKKAIELFQQLTDKFDAVSVQIPVVQQLQPFLLKHPLKNRKPIDGWLKALLSLLEQRTAEEPQSPGDDARAAVLNCKCANCSTVNRFLESPDQKEFAFRARQDLRGHVEHSITRDKADLRTETIRKGSPQTLLCTKTVASWQRRHDIWKKDCESLAIIRTMLSPSKSSASDKRPRKK